MNQFELREQMAEAKQERADRMAGADEALEHARANLRVAELAHAKIAADVSRNYEADLEALLELAAAELGTPSTAEDQPATPPPTDATKRGVCPDCGKEVQRTTTGLRVHNLENGMRCRPKGNAGGDPEVAPPATPPVEEPRADPPPTANPATGVDAQAASLFE